MTLRLLRAWIDWLWSGWSAAAGLVLVLALQLTQLQSKP